MKHLKPYRIFEAFEEPEIRLNDTYFLGFWMDDEDDDGKNIWNVSIIEYGYEDENCITFACEDPDDMSVEITNHGLKANEYLNDEQIQLLDMYGLTIGKVFNNMKEVYDTVKSQVTIFNSQKLRNTNDKTKIFEKIKKLE